MARRHADDNVVCWVICCRRDARLRPATPGYPTISSAFDRAARDIRDGRDVQESLDEAVDTIERDIADNRDYGFHE
ncbi:hypothetical protein MKP05_04360 [Halomonas sp. EGI 63088]|uniref:Uncharacterized protein n=1 Tax=Halomonas flagellata TaxID=2920385 RepID=A0ABS9RRB6_9GAMM|nr:hypothetical protein [Halomonas flagellata]MCH4562366.1 hypothetical protein [Halomonas flagellata]